MKWIRVKSIAKTYYKGFLRDKSSVFWVILWPILLLILTAFVFVPPSAGRPLEMDVGVINMDHSQTPFNGSALVDILNKTEVNGTRIFNVRLLDNTSKLRNLLQKGKLDAGLIIPEGFGKNIMYGSANLTVLVGGESQYDLQVHRAVITEFFAGISKEIAYRKVAIMLQYISNMSFANQTLSLEGKKLPLIDLIKNYMYGLVEPLNTTYKTVAPKAVMFRKYILGWYALGAVGMMMLYTGFVIGATAIAEEKDKRRLKRLMSTPISETDLLAGKMLGGFIILLISSIITLVVAIALHAKLTWNPKNPVDWLVPLHYIYIAVMTISIGFLIALVSETEKGASNLAVMLGLILAFIAGVWFPSSWMPGPLRALAHYFPVTVSLDAIRKIVVYSSGMRELLYPTLYSTFSSIILFVIGVFSYKKTLRKYIER